MMPSVLRHDGIAGNARTWTGTLQLGPVEFSVTAVLDDEGRLTLTPAWPRCPVALLPRDKMPEWYAAIVDAGLAGSS